VGGGRLKADTELLGDLFGGQSVRDQFNTSISRGVSGWWLAST
jgi:hypothetical protein